MQITITIRFKRDMILIHIDSILIQRVVVSPIIRMLVYQYMENSNVDKWLHHDDSEISPLTWDIRMRILLGTAKG